MTVPAWMAIATRLSTEMDPAEITRLSRELCEALDAALTKPSIKRAPVDVRHPVTVGDS
jgi:hypothetical protein